MFPITCQPKGRRHIAWRRTAANEDRKGGFPRPGSHGLEGVKKRYSKPLRPGRLRREKAAASRQATSLLPVVSSRCTERPSLSLEFLHLGLTAKHQSTTALARLRERGDREAVGEGFGFRTSMRQLLRTGRKFRAGDLSAERRGLLDSPPPCHAVTATNRNQLPRVPKPSARTDHQDSLDDQQGRPQGTRYREHALASSTRASRRASTWMVE